MSKVSARWVPRNPTAQDRVRRVMSSQEFLDFFTSDQDKFVRHIVTGDETWIHYWDLECKQRVDAMDAASSPPPRKFKTAISWQDYGDHLLV